jgi:hypothetical protein
VHYDESLTLCSPDVLYVDNLAVFLAKFRAGGLIAATRISHVWVEMPLGSSDSRLSIDIISLRYDGRLW